jgi:glycine cleavage system H protein
MGSRFDLDLVDWGLAQPTLSINLKKNKKRIEMNELKFTSTHEWLIMDQEEEVTIGITDHAQQLLGDMVFVELPEIGARVTAGQELGVVESVKAASDFYAPISGIITAVNSAVIENPAIVNSDPYRLGWLVKMKPSELNEINALLDANQYKNEIVKDN